MICRSSGFKSLDQRHQLRERHLPVRIRRYLQRLNFFQAQQQLRARPPLRNDVGCRRVVSDAIDPRSQRAQSAKAFERSPQRKMNFLKEVATLFRVGFITTGETSQRRAEFRGGLLVKLVLTSHA